MIVSKRNKLSGGHILSRRQYLFEHLLMGNKSSFLSRKKKVNELNELKNRQKVYSDVKGESVVDEDEYQKNDHENAQASAGGSVTVRGYIETEKSNCNKEGNEDDTAHLETIEQTNNHDQTKLDLLDNSLHSLHSEATIYNSQIDEVPGTFSCYSLLSTNNKPAPKKLSPKALAALAEEREANKKSFLYRSYLTGAIILAVMEPIAIAYYPINKVVLLPSRPPVL